MPVFDLNASLAFVAEYPAQTLLIAVAVWAVGRYVAEPLTKWAISKRF